MWYDYTTVQPSPREAGGVPDGVVYSATIEEVPDEDDEAFQGNSLGVPGSVPRRHSPSMFLQSARRKALMVKRIKNDHNPDNFQAGPQLPSWMAHSRATSRRTSFATAAGIERGDDVEDDKKSTATHIKGIPKLQIMRPNDAVAANSGLAVTKPDEEKKEKTNRESPLRKLFIRDRLFKLCYLTINSRYIFITALEIFFITIYIILLSISIVLACLEYSAQTTGNLAVAGIVIWFSVIGIYNVLWILAMVPYDSRTNSRCNLVGFFGSIALIAAHVIPLLVDDDDDRGNNDDDDHENITGWISAGVFLLIGFSSLPGLKRTAHKLCNLVNMISVIGFFVVCGWFHRVYFVNLAILFIIIDVIGRVCSVLSNLFMINKASLVRLPSNVIRVEMKKNENFHFQPGQHIRVCIPQVSLFHWRPLSIHYSPQPNSLFLHVQVQVQQDPWSEKLYQVASDPKSKESLNVLFCGPFGKPSIDIWNADKYSVFLSINSGSGVTAGQSICNALLQQHKQGQRKLNKVFYVWSVIDSFNIVNKLHCDPELANPLLYHLPYSFQPDLLDRSLCDPKVLHASFHMTKVRIPHEYPEGNIRLGIQQGLTLTRLHMSVEFEQAFQFCFNNSVPRVAVILSAPRKFLNEVQFLCRSWSKKGVKFDLHVESLTL
ncbi:uncharacterized protein LOC142344792 isoform X2 [Convolutriloba macropyga]|uniref:uncharacterized protein LOC142344792 isoform X2 n=1 Tax=Convolutriloba macropyga TaxID=536237 RepID=UPI003F5276C5